MMRLIRPSCPRLFSLDGRLLRPTPSRAGFTLVEMLVVLVIIGMLVSLVAPRVFNQLADARVRTAKIQIETFKEALDLFYLDMGRYPTNSEGLNALEIRPTAAATWNGPYLKTDGVPLDPWNDAYQYKSPGDAGRPYEITSAGPHGHDGGADVASTIKSW